jgi:hypothetical protein
LWANPRFIVTSFKAAESNGRVLFRTFAAPGDMENGIKECQCDLFVDRTSTATMRANELRLWFALFAYVLPRAIRRVGLAHTQVRRCDLRHDPAQAPQARGPRARQPAPHQIR